MYLFDTSNNMYLSVSGALNDIVASSVNPDENCKFNMVVLDDNTVAFQASNGQYLSRILYGSDPFSSGNYIQAGKATIDYFSRFGYTFAFTNPPANRPHTIGKIALQSDNGRYWERQTTVGSVNYIKPLATSKVYFDVLVAV